MDKRVDDTLGRKKASRDWMRANFWPEIEEVFRFYKARTEPIIDPVTNKEDTTRTNICMPDYWTIGRKKGARLSARPPTLDVRAKTPVVSQLLSAYSRLQWDKAGEQKHQKRHSLQAQLFGLSIKQHWYDEVAVLWPFRRRPQEVLGKFGVFEHEEGKFRLATEEENEKKQSRPFSDLDEVMQADTLASVGPELVAPERITKYSGPVSGFVFFGDFYPEPEFETVDSSAWIITEDNKDLEWLAYFAKRKFVDPDTGEERPVLDKKAVVELAEQDPWQMKDRGSEDELKERLRAVIYKSRPEFDVKLIPGKRFLITTEHTFRKGWPWIRWIGNEKIFLGEMPYPWDLQGRYAFSTLTPIPDLLTGVGDSSPRILRHMMRLNNVSVAQAVDLVTNVAKVLLRKRPGADLPAEILDRGLYRVIECEKADLEPLLQGVGTEAMGAVLQNISMIFRKMQLGEPALTDFGEQSQAAPESQKRVGIAMLQNRVSESLSQDELEQLSESLARETTIKLLMKQQTMNQPEEVEQQWFNMDRLKEAMNEAGAAPGAMEELQARHPAFLRGISLAAGGDLNFPKKFVMDQLEIQEDFEVYPELGSTLALDDVMKKQEAVEIYTLASGNPLIWNVRAAARLLATTFKGARAEDLILPEPPPDQPKGPEPKVNIGLSIKWAELDETTKAEILQNMGLQPPADMPLRETIEGIKKLSEGADAAANLATQEQPETEGPVQ